MDNEQSTQVVDRTVTTAPSAEGDLAALSARLAHFRYDDLGNQMLLPLIPAATKVLDVGCSTGNRAAWLKQNRNCYVAGIEVDRDMAAVAQERCDSLVLADLDDLPDLPYANSSFDVVVFGDVLEHLKNPEGLLIHLTDYLRPDGLILISIPNFVFLDVRLKVLFGQFRYAKNGILDSTHLRFYTRQTLREMLDECGFTITKWGYTAAWFGITTIVPGPVRRLMARIWPTLFAAEFVVTCTRTAPE